MSVTTVLAVSFFGGLGAITRFVCDTLIKSIKESIFPWSTLIINTLACVLFGYALLAWHNPHTLQLYSLATTGFLGGFSTFSTAMNEIVVLARKKYWFDCAVYTVFAVLIPCIAFYMVVVFA